MSFADQDLFSRNYGLVDIPSSIIGCYETEAINMPHVKLTDSKSHIIAITGSMNTLQTLNGLRDFRDKYYAIFKELCPNWKIIIAGRNPVSEIMTFQKENSHNVDIIANPESMDDIINNSSIFFCPTNVGGGIKLRLMDGLKHGRPVLVHQVSARGYESLFNEPFFRVYHDEETFRSGLLDVLNYVKNQNNPSDILQKYLDYFSFEAGTKRYAKVFETLRNVL